MNLNRDLYQLFHEDISLEYTAHFHYLQCRIALEHQSVGLPGLAKFFAGEASEEWDHAKAFIDKLQQRGGQFSFSNLDKTGILEASFNLGDPTKIGASICDMIAKSLYLEKEVAKKVLEIKNVADKYEDADVLYIALRIYQILTLVSKNSLKNIFHTDSYKIFDLLVKIWNKQLTLKNFLKDFSMDRPLD